MRLERTSLAVVILIACSGLAFSPAPTRAGAISCKTVLDRPATRFPLTREEGAELVDQAFGSHPTLNGLTEPLMERMVDTTFENIDPWQMLLLKSEVATFKTLLKSDVHEAIQDYFMQRQQPGTPIASARHLAAAKLVALYDVLVKTPNFRNRVLARAEKEMKIARARTDAETDAAVKAAEDKDHHPETEDARIERLVTILANQAAMLQLAGLEPKDSYVITVRRTLRFMNRQYDLLADESQPTLMLSTVLASLDPHSAYVTGEDVGQFDMMTRSKKRSLAGIAFDETAKGFRVVRVVPDLPAAKAGFQVGDLITHLDGKFVRGIEPADLRELMNGEPGSHLSMTVTRGSEKLTLTLERAEAVSMMSATGIQSKIVKSAAGILGVIRLQSFYDGAAEDVRNKAELLIKTGGAKGLVLDLRDNGGGLLNEAHGILDYFIAEGPLFRFQQGKEGGQRRVAEPANGKRTEIPLVVLVNEHSASASELTSIVLQDYGRAIVVGSKQTYGKGSVQTTFPARNPQTHGMVKLTTGLYYSVSGKSPQLGGVESDIVITEQPAGIHLERMYKGVLDAGKLDSELEREYPLMPDHEQVVSYLREHSYQRLESQKGSKQETSDESTESEATKVLSDLIRLREAQVPAKN